MAHSLHKPNTFSVLRFSLEAQPDGQRRHRVRNAGRFADIETAFHAARLQAWQARQVIAQDRDISFDGAPREPQVLGTEWGYDVRIGAMTVARFWVHDAQSADAMAV